MDRVLEEEEHAWRGAGVALVDQHRAALDQVALALERQVEHGVEQRVAGADEGGERLAGRRDQRLFEGDALVACEHRITGADLAVAVAHRRGDVRELVAARLAFARAAAQALEGFEEERLDVVRLQPPRLGTLHVLAHACDAARVHRVVCEGALFEQVLDVGAVHSMLDGAREARAHVGPVAVADGLDQ